MTPDSLLSPKGSSVAKTRVSSPGLNAERSERSRKALGEGGVSDLSESLVPQQRCTVNLKQHTCNFRCSFTNAVTLLLATTEQMIGCYAVQKLQQFGLCVLKHAHEAFFRKKFFLQIRGVKKYDRVLGADEDFF